MKKIAKGADKDKTPTERKDGKGFERFKRFARKIVSVPKDEIEKAKTDSLTTATRPR